MGERGKSVGGWEAVGIHQPAAAVRCRQRLCPRHGTAADIPSIVLLYTLPRCNPATHPLFRTTLPSFPPSCLPADILHIPPPVLLRAGVATCPPPLRSPSFRRTTNPPALPVQLRDANMTPPSPLPHADVLQIPPPVLLRGSCHDAVRRHPLLQPTQEHILQERVPRTRLATHMGGSSVRRLPRLLLVPLLRLKCGMQGGGCISRPTQEHLLQDHVPSPRLTAHPVECNVCWRTTMPRCRLF